MAILVAVLAVLMLLPRFAVAEAPPIAPPQRLDAGDVPYPLQGRGDASVLLTLTVSATGEVIDVVVRQGSKPFATAAATGVRHWRFAPATRDEVPIAARILAKVTFHAPVEVPPPSTIVAAAPQAN